jgi:hypothetical protein
MMSYYAWFALFAIVAFLIVTDNSIARAFYMLTQLARVQYEKVKWWIQHSPANPIVRYFIWKRSMKMAEELMKELDEKSKS